jgi:alanine racemase
MSGTPSAQSGAVLSVDLDAIAGNWLMIKSRLATGCRSAAVLKADGYGLGAVPIARALSKAGCTRFFVATLDEAIALRAALSEPEIIVLNGVEAETVGIFRAHRLIPMLNSPLQLGAWGAAGPCALHIDTGMSRLGVTLNEAHALTPPPDLLLISSHLACADEPDQPMNRQQLREFAALRPLFPRIEASLAASSGIFLGPEWHADWVRPGAALYGVNPTRGLANPMAQVVRLEAKILQIREIDQGGTVGYGATHRAGGKARLATVAVGYADGLMRCLSNRGHGFVGDKRVPLVGRISMDLTVFDVSSVAQADLAPGATIQLIGPGNTIDDLAEAAGTIGYEILTSLGPRLHRRYLSSHTS